MSTWNKGMTWLLALAGGITLGAAAVALSQPQSVEKLATAPLHTPNDLSLAFRAVSEHVLPAVVAITAEAEAQAVEIRGNGRQLSPLEKKFLEQYRDDPRFQEMFDYPEQGYLPPQEGSGSGFIVDAAGIVLTNSHVVEGATKLTVTLADGREIVADSWDFDPRTDIAVVRITSETPLPVIALADSDEMQVGDWVLALGNPFNVGTTVTAGIVSARGRGPGINEREDYLQTDAAINPGNSGGPLVNLNGDVVGINTAISSRSGGYDGIGFAIPANMVRWVADQLIAKGRVERSYLGVKLQPLSEEIRSQLGVPRGAGALINEVFPNTPSAKAGLQVGDVILEFAGEQILDESSLVETVEQSAPDKSYDALVLRSGKEQTIPVVLELMPADYTPALKRTRSEPTDKLDGKTEVGSLGLQVSALTPEIAEGIGLDADAHGVVVRGVKVNTPAARAGLQPGDLIQRVGGAEVNSIEEFGTAVKGADLEKGILLYILRGESAAFVVLK